MLNHKSFIEKANNILDMCKSTGNIFLYYLDVANFKLVNYFYGIEKGTELLQAIADYLQSLPQVVYSERIFSDQFVFIVVTQEPKSDKEIMDFYTHVVEAFLKKEQVKYPACRLKFNCGIHRVENRNVLEALDLANMARMDARKTGAPTAMIYTAMIYTAAKLEELTQEKKREAEIMLALHEGRFTFFLQPKVDLRTGDIVGAEALARRLAPDGSVVYPDTFVPILEANGAITELDYYIFEQVCAYLQQKIEQGLPGIRISVNLSRLHVFNTETADRLLALAAQYHVPPELLELELTESILLHEFAEAQVMVDKLRAYGFGVSIDDFGSGYTGINIFQELNFNVLKLDRRFLSDDPAMQERNAAIIPSIVSIAHKLGLYVICEGVERADQCRYLLDLGCNYVQGFYFSKAVPPDQLYKICREQNGRYPLHFRDE